MESDLVQQDVSPNTSLKCITDHPGFQPVCLQKWSLRMAAGKYRTKGKEQYRQRGSEERLVLGCSNYGRFVPWSGQFVPQKH